MEPFAELYGCTSRQTLEFFFLWLKDLAGSHVEEIDIMYNASVLAHFAQVSRESSGPQIAFADLSDVFDNYVFNFGMGATDAESMETAGAHILFLGGFLQDQMRHRHNINWYLELGRAFYSRAKNLTPVPAKRPVLSRVGANLTFWAGTHCQLHRELRDNPYDLRRIRPPA